MSTNYAVGLDLGQAKDYSALAVVEHVDRLPAGFSLAGFWERVDRVRAGLQGPEVLPVLSRELRVRHLQRWPLGTPYDVIVDDVAALVSRPELSGSRFFFDRSGVGRPVGDLLWTAYGRGQLGATQPHGRTITGAERSSASGTAKRDLIAALELPLQQGRFKIPHGLPLADVLERELLTFKMRLTAKTGREVFDVERRPGEGHGDLVIATALACVHPEYGVAPDVAAG